MLCSLTLHCLLVLLFVNSANGMLKSPVEQQDKASQFWTLLLQPAGSFRIAVKPVFSNPRTLTAEQSQKPTTDAPDYYDAVRAEDEQVEPQEKARQEQQKQQKEERQAMHLFTALRANIDPLSPLMVDSDVSTAAREDSSTSSDKIGTGDSITATTTMMEPIVFTAKDSSKSAIEKGKSTLVDGDTHMDGRGAVVRAAGAKMLAVDGETSSKMPNSTAKNVEAVKTTTEGSSEEEGDDDVTEGVGTNSTLSTTMVDGGGNDDDDGADEDGSTTTETVDDETTENNTKNATNAAVRNNASTKKPLTPLLAPPALPPRAKMFTIA